MAEIFLQTLYKRELSYNLAEIVSPSLVKLFITVDRILFLCSTDV